MVNWNWSKANKRFDSYQSSIPQIERYYKETGKLNIIDDNLTIIIVQKKFWITDSSWIVCWIVYCTIGIVDNVNKGNFLELMLILKASDNNIIKRYFIDR